MLIHHFNKNWSQIWIFGRLSHLYKFQTYRSLCTPEDRNYEAALQRTNSPHFSPVLGRAFSSPRTTCLRTQAPFWLCSELEWQTDLPLQINFEVFYWSWIFLWSDSKFSIACIRGATKWPTKVIYTVQGQGGDWGWRQTPRLLAKSPPHETTPLLYSWSENVG